MVIDFHALRIRLYSNDERILNHWRELFDYEIVCKPPATNIWDCEIQLDVQVKNALPPAPSPAPDYSNDDPPLGVYNTERAMPMIRISHVGQVMWRLKRDSLGKPMHASAKVIITEGAFNLLALDNLTTLSLAPLFRRCGIFVTHAFAAAQQDRAVMFVGPSGSGKTSCGLALAAGGWQFLANDMTLIRAGEPIRALLSPGSVQVSPITGSLLPQYTPLLNKYAHYPLSDKVSVPRLEFLSCDATVLSAPLKFIFFPSVTQQAEHRVERVARGVGLARLMEYSMDQWDSEGWEEHVAFLERLSQQAEFYWLHLGRNMAELPHFLATTAINQQNGRA